MPAKLRTDTEPKHYGLGALHDLMTLPDEELPGFVPPTAASAVSEFCAPQDTQPDPARGLRRALQLAAVGLLVGLICLLSACGGGETDEDPPPDRQPVDCKAHPEQCQ